mmetsp:Transcript_80172/g.235849  ORF Transcript_80172/g.235849 Transcript_80172/m.235849 type:complete len:217 (+) Transcript_80172:694-1344(+)
MAMHPVPSHAALAMPSSLVRWDWPPPARPPCRQGQGPPCRQSGSSPTLLPVRLPSLPRIDCRQPLSRCRRHSRGSGRGGPRSPSPIAPCTLPPRSCSLGVWQRRPPRDPAPRALRAGHQRRRCPRRSQSSGARAPSPPRTACPVPVPAPPGSAHRRCSPRGGWGSNGCLPPSPPTAMGRSPSGRTPLQSHTLARGSRQGSHPPWEHLGSGTGGGSG